MHRSGPWFTATSSRPTSSSRPPVGPSWSTWAWPAAWSRSNSQDLTQSGVTLGTFDYISPEQALEPREADVRSDIYSLGCTFYHVLTGQSPVPEGTAARKLHHHQHVLPTDPRQLNPDIPDEVAAILARMMAKDPNQRYQRFEHLVQHLLQVTQTLGIPARHRTASCSWMRRCRLLPVPVPCSSG